jgi:hypothetical protein
VTLRSRLLGVLVFALASAKVGGVPEADAAPSSPASLSSRMSRAAETALLLAQHGEASAEALPEREYDLIAPTATYETWRGLGTGCSYLAPRDAGATVDGKVDVVVHFHAGQMVEREIKESAGGAVFVSCGFGMGSGPYADAFADPNRLGQMLKSLVASLERTSGRSDLTVRHLGLASWSAGFAAVGRILGVERYYAMVDSVVLNDSLHAGYTPGPNGASKKPLQGEARVDLAMIKGFVRFAKDAAAGSKTMVMTHSAIVPPDYASSTEATRAVLSTVGVDATPDATTNDRGMQGSYRAERGNLHVQGFRGAGPRDHFDHLHLLAGALRTWIVPAWRGAEDVRVGDARVGHSPAAP